MTSSCHVHGHVTNKRKVGNPSLFSGGIAVQSRANSHTFTVNLAVPPSQDDAKTVEGSVNLKQAFVPFQNTWPHPVDFAAKLGVLRKGTLKLQIRALGLKN